MTIGKLTGAITVAMFAALPGCGSSPHDLGFGQVQATVEQQIGKRVQWNRGSTDDAAAASAVRSLLSRELTVDAAVQIALLNNPALQATFEDLGIAQADLVQAGLLKNPVFFLSSRFPISGGATDLELAVAQDFVDVLLLPLRKKVAAATFEASRQRVISAVIDLAGETRCAFYSLQGAQQMLEMRQSIRAAAAAALDAARKLREAGNTRELDLANQQSLEEQAELEAESADAEARESRQRLTLLMGIVDDEGWIVSSRLPELPSTEIADAATLERSAIAHRADLIAAGAEVRSAASQFKLVKPFSLFTDATVGVDGEQDPHGGWVVGPTVQIPIPLFDTGSAKVSRAEGAWRQAIRRYASLSLRVRGEVRSALLRLHAARIRATRFRTRILPLRGRIVVQTQLQYNAMQVGIFELLQSRQMQIDAGREYIQSLLEYWIARTDLEKATGGRIDSLPASNPTTAGPTSPGEQP